MTEVLTSHPWSPVILHISSDRPAPWEDCPPPYQLHRPSPSSSLWGQEASAWPIMLSEHLWEPYRWCIKQINQSCGTIPGSRSTAFRRCNDIPYRRWYPQEHHRCQRACEEPCLWHRCSCCSALTIRCSIWKEESWRPIVRSALSCSSWSRGVPHQGRAWSYLLL